MTLESLVHVGSCPLGEPRGARVFLAGHWMKTDLSVLPVHGTRGVTRVAGVRARSLARVGTHLERVDSMKFYGRSGDNNVRCVVGPR
jgi:hypothetical protein